MSNFHTPTTDEIRRRIPSSWVRIRSPNKISTAKYCEIVDWVLSSGALTRGVISTERCLNIDIVPNQILWEMFKQALRRMLDDFRNLPNNTISALLSGGVAKDQVALYNLELYFADPEDAVMLKMKFL